MVYRISKPKMSVDALDLDTISLANKIAKTSSMPVNDIIKVLMSQAYSNTSFTSLFTGSFDCEFNQEALSDDFDINVLGTFIVFKPSAFEILKPLIQDFGEFIEINTNRGLMILFNLLTFGNEDLSLTEVKYSDGFEDGLHSLVFIESDVKNKPIFKSKMEGANLIYCNEDFFNVVKRNNLTGIDFYKDLLSIFPVE